MSRTPTVKPATIRIIAIQILLFGLLFLPDYSLYHLTFGRMDISKIVYTLAMILDNPAFYILLIVVALIFTFTFEYALDVDRLKQGGISIGRIFMTVILRILLLYVGLFLASWLFLTYKLMFMGHIYINHLVFNF